MVIVIDKQKTLQGGVFDDNSAIIFSRGQLFKTNDVVS